MKIKTIEVFALHAPDSERPHWVSNFIVPRANEILVQLKTDSGIEGFGMATSYTSVEPIVEAFRGGIAEFILGSDALAPERLYHRLFGLTSRRLAQEKGWGRESLIRISSAVDIACWDIIGKAAGLPLYRLFGGYRNRIPYYVTCGYYRDGKDIFELRDEMEELRAQGHTSFKAKVGGLTLSEDIKRLEVVRDVIGGESDLMVDVNRGWDFATALEGFDCWSHFSRAGWRSRSAGLMIAVS